MNTKKNHGKSSGWGEKYDVKKFEGGGESYNQDRFFLPFGEDAYSYDTRKRFFNLNRDVIKRKNEDLKDRQMEYVLKLEKLKKDLLNDENSYDYDLHEYEKIAKRSAKLEKLLKEFGY